MNVNFVVLIKGSYTIDEMIQDAENGKKIQTITVELTQM